MHSVTQKSRYVERTLQYKGNFNLVGKTGPLKKKSHQRSVPPPAVGYEGPGTWVVPPKPANVSTTHRRQNHRTRQRRQNLAATPWAPWAGFVPPRLALSGRTAAACAPKGARRPRGRAVAHACGPRAAAEATRHATPWASWAEFFMSRLTLVAAQPSPTLPKVPDAPESAVACVDRH